MFGYATRETKELMPMPISLAHKLAHRLAEVRRAEMLVLPAPRRQDPGHGALRDGQPVAIEKILISTQHKPGVDAETLIKPDLWEHVVRPILPASMYDERTLLDDFLVNPTGKFEIGGPMGDCGLTGRKIIVDTYGGDGPPRRRRVLRQGPVEGRPLGRLRRALRGEERGRGRPGRPAARCRWRTRSAWRTRCR